MINAPQKAAEQKSGLNCPKCQFFIQMAIEDLLYKQAFVCPGCQLELKMMRGQSTESLELLQKVHVAHKNLESVKQFDL